MQLIWIRHRIKPNVFAYAAMIDAFLSKDKEDKAFEFYNDMSKSGIKPDVATYGTFMSYFEKKKNRTGAENILAEMRIQGVQPDKAILRILNALGVK